MKNMHIPMAWSLVILSLYTVALSLLFIQTISAVDMPTEPHFSATER